MSISPDAGCFACASDGPRVGRVRLLCPEHVAVCRLADGALLRAVLANATPVDGLLEGSLLGWLYNPVHVEDRTGVRRLGWTDFTAGAMGVLEDVFGAQQFFDVWTVEHPEGAALLQDIRRSSPAQLQRRLRGSHWRYRGFAALAYSLWREGLAIQARLSSLGRWPESFAELRRVIGRAADEPAPAAFDDDPEFAAYLAALADRVPTALPPN